MKNVCKLFAGTALVLFVLAEGIFMVPEKMKKVYVNWFDKQYSMIEQNYTEKTHRKELNYVISLISSFDKKDYTITHDSSSQLPDSVKSLNPGIQGHEDTYSLKTENGEQYTIFARHYKNIGTDFEEIILCAKKYPSLFVLNEPPVNEMNSKDSVIFVQKYAGASRKILFEKNKMTFFESHLSCQGKKYYTFHYKDKGFYKGLEQLFNAMRNMPEKKTSDRQPNNHNRTDKFKRDAFESLYPRVFSGK